MDELEDVRRVIAALQMLSDRIDAMLAPRPASAGMAQLIAATQLKGDGFLLRPTGGHPSLNVAMSTSVRRYCVNLLTMSARSFSLNGLGRICRSCAEFGRSSAFSE